jgi:hypothetical protein
MSTSPSKMPTILLYSLWQASLIILHPSGVMYQNQTCNHACRQRRAEGVLVPLIDIPLDEPRCPLEHALADLEWWPVQGIDSERADRIDAILQRWRATVGIRVDRSRLHESEEAWVYTIVEPNGTAVYDGFGTRRAILTWSNSD